MDEIDLAQERENTRLEIQIQASLSSPRIASHNGMCIWCIDEPVVESAAFCSTDCDVDYHKYQREKKQKLR